VHDVARLHRHHEDTQIATDGRARRIALWVLWLFALTTAFDITITNVALPSVGEELKAPTSELQWVVDAYNIVLAGLLVLGGTTGPPPTTGVLDAAAGRRSPLPRPPDTW
jgi:MFS family permease